MGKYSGYHMISQSILITETHRTVLVPLLYACILDPAGGRREHDWNCPTTVGGDTLTGQSTRDSCITRSSILRPSHPLDQPGRYPKMARENRRLSAVHYLALVGYSSKVYTCMVWLVGERQTWLA